MTGATTQAQDLTAIYYLGAAHFTAKSLAKALNYICDDQGQDLHVFVVGTDPDQPISRIQYMRGPRGNVVALELVAE